MAKPDSKTPVYDAIVREILTLEFAPGSPLDEVSLSTRFNLSRTPMREVLQRLAGAGFVDIQPNRGAKVASLDLPTLRIFFQTAPLIYSSVARMAAENRTTEQIDQLREIQAFFVKAVIANDAAKAAVQNHRFHHKIGEMSANPYLMAALQRMLIDHTRLSQTFYRPATDDQRRLVKTAGQQHDAMITAIEAREPEVAVELTLKHWDLSRDQLERFVSPDPLPLDVINLKDHKNAV